MPGFALKGEPVHHPLMLVQHGRLPETQSTDMAHVAARVPTSSSYAGAATALASTSATGAGASTGAKGCWRRRQLHLRLDLRRLLVLDRPCPARSFAQ